IRAFYPMHEPGYFVAPHLSVNNAHVHPTFGSFRNWFSFVVPNGAIRMNESYLGSGEKLNIKSEEVFNKIYLENIDKLSYFAHKNLPTWQDAEDLCNDVFAKIWEGREKLADIKDIDRFLFTSVKNAILNFLEKERNISAREKEWVERVRQASKPEEILDLRDNLKT